MFDWYPIKILLSYNLHGMIGELFLLPMFTIFCYVLIWWRESLYHIWSNPDVLGCTLDTNDHLQLPNSLFLHIIFNNFYTNVCSVLGTIMNDYDHLRSYHKHSWMTMSLPWSLQIITICKCSWSNCKWSWLFAVVHKNHEHSWKINCFNYCMQSIRNIYIQRHLWRNSSAILECHGKSFQFCMHVHVNHVFVVWQVYVTILGVDYRSVSILTHIVVVQLIRCQLTCQLHFQYFLYDSVMIRVFAVFVEVAGKSIVARQNTISCHFEAFCLG